MTDGIPCKRCGWEEAQHDLPDLDPDEYLNPREGYQISLYACRDEGAGYSADEPELANCLESRETAEELVRKMSKVPFDSD